MPTYETVFITPPTLTEDEEKTTVSTMVQAVTENGGLMVAAERMGRRRLAYVIKKFDEGVYQRFLYDAPPALPREIERRMRISDRVLRHITVRLDEEWAVAAKEQAVRDAAARAEAEVARAAAAAAEAEASKEAARVGEPAERPTGGSEGEAEGGEED